MTIQTTYRIPGPIKARYVGKAACGNHYRWCEQSAKNPAYDIAQGTCSADELPTEIRKKCDEYNGIAYACEWPLDA